MGTRLEPVRRWLWKICAVLTITQLTLAIVELLTHDEVTRVWFAFIESGVIALITLSAYLNRGRTSERRR